MKTFTLRTVRQNDYATYSELFDDTAAKVACTLELPWKDNAHDVSCIPRDATYTACRRDSAEHECELFGLVDVPGRGDIEMHIGCLPRDTKGCILLGTAFGQVDYADGRPGAKGYGITGSGAAFKRFMNLLDGFDEFRLVVVGPSPTLQGQVP